jgi:hypothetical protein
VEGSVQLVFHQQLEQKTKPAQRRFELREIRRRNEHEINSRGTFVPPFYFLELVFTTVVGSDIAI